LTFFPQVKEYLPQHALRRILALQTELMRNSTKDSNNRNITGPQRAMTLPNPPTPQRTLLSANFANPNANINGGRISNNINTNGRMIPGSNLTRNLVAAGDRLRDLIIPESLASVVGGVWGTGGGGGAGRGASKKGTEGVTGREAEKVERMKEELDELLASSCPLCESVVAGLDKPFVADGEVDDSWQL